MHEVGQKPARGPEPDPLDLATREIGIAIELVLSGGAMVVQLSGLDGAERAAALGLAEVQTAGVEFALLRSGSPSRTVSLRIGPRLGD